MRASYDGRRSVRVPFSKNLLETRTSIEKNPFVPVVTSPRRRRILTTTHSSLQVRISSGVVSKICFVTTLSFTSCPPILDLQKDLALFSSLSDTSSLFVGKSNHHDLLVSTDTTTTKERGWTTKNTNQDPTTTICSSSFHFRL